MVISVIISAFNGEKYILQQLESILSQTLVPSEILICDDASNDNTVEIIKRFCNNTDIVIKLVEHKINEGVRNSFIELISKTVGDIVLFCDQDDYWYKNKIEEFVNVFKKDENIAAVLSNADIVDENLKKTGVTLWKSLNFVPVTPPNIKYEMLKRNIFTGMCMAIRKEWALTCPVCSEHMLHDEFFGWCACLNDKAIILDKPLAAYRQHANNVVGINQYTKFRGIKRTKEKILQSNIYTRNKFKDLENIAFTRNYEIYQEIKKAEKFYSMRVDLFKLGKLEALKNCFLSFIHGNYNTYCSKTEKAFLKDLLCIIL